jgi:hypothetical protein
MTIRAVRALLVHLLDTRVWDPDEILRWSHWRMARNRQAAASHRKRRAAERRRDGRRHRMRSRARDPALWCYSLQKSQYGARGIWVHRLSRRCRGRPMKWIQFLRLQRRFAPPRSRVVHGSTGSVSKSRDDEPVASLMDFAGFPCRCIARNY